ncbi:diacylglycerol O-acyltransferase 1 isoform X1 [Anopheles stephensi]|uniref:O-acyltransferase n=1 Tax=Anopheles stephensi TaxID=30069 RepID=A0A182YPP4_ANOST|nr:diacylglycerol O-acyltransferase 1 isoform X1 [Anopheles stephensi]XP_035916694.1 diacylglycerol O-acyltransferase 1 isoform X1 [Anopheles stephensi]XP_035916695.1 diacylglycerol O-acyltransferase 1 isoform X1 [Anopheles stephensi]XP_035916696.1 diacylglycerol O-acyltransferase 1 isoform X1 [Anopheles stephensi]XP_035916697.1 diacylglycerol O-acyltransferase 1 isoform X1 [Anopheles stephensi]XP_035916698.1 diacylglycerol O-acyltransferase 1 isoform X1 [Anopheles stephensi]XP_035916699.1 di
MSGETHAATEENKLRYRRTQSVTRAEEITKKESEQRKSQPDKPCHRPRDSLFSWSSGFDNFTGLVNWGFLLLTMGGVRLVLENFIKYVLAQMPPDYVHFLTVVFDLVRYGIRVDPVQWFTVLTGKGEGEGYPSLLLLSYSLVPVMICLMMERSLASDIIPESAGMTVHIINIIVLVLIPMVVIHVKGHIFSLVGAMTVCFIYCILFLKLWSYVQVNLWCRSEKKQHRHSRSGRRQSITIAQLQNGRDQEAERTANGNSTSNYTDKDKVPALVHYPDNLHPLDLLYFLLAPTLCYELNFPKTNRIRKRFLIKRMLEVVIGVHIVMGLFQQWMIPSVRNSLVPFSNMDLTKMTERLLKLAIPNHLMWLCFFYLTFHSFLNLMGELLHFADRNFYSDWWNANNIDTFWRTWNMPVHKWCVRHLYIPVVELGYSKVAASVIVFFFSAFFHEYLVSVPLKTFKVWAFTGMMAQIPLSFVAKYMETNYGPRWGNMLVWASIILGQPLAIMMYYHDFVITNYNDVLV